MIWIAGPVIEHAQQRAIEVNRPYLNSVNVICELEKALRVPAF
jgi:hypothetical protein